MNYANWYKDPVIHGLLVVALTHTLVHYKLISQWTDTDIGTVVDGALSIIQYMATAYSAYYARKVLPPKE